MQKSILLTLLLCFTAIFSTAQTPKIAFIDWDSIHNQVDLYKTHEIEVARFKAFVQEVDSLKVIHFEFLVDSFHNVARSCFPTKEQELMYENHPKRINDAIKEIEIFEASLPKIIKEFESKSKQWADDFLKLKIRYHADLQGFKYVYGVNKLLFSREDFNKKIIESINRDENAKEAQAYFIKFLNNKIKFDYNLE